MMFSGIAVTSSGLVTCAARQDSAEKLKTGGSMGLALWHFLRPRPGELRPVASAAFDAFYFHDGRLPADEHGLVLYLQVVVRLENRHAVEVVSVGAFQSRTLADGRLDREHLDDIHRLVGETMSAGILPRDRVPGVIDAGGRFAKRRLDHLNTWQPSEAELALLRQLVNKKAGRQIM
jgi:hypothetical protein